jgi:hypothetical protein
MADLTPSCSTLVMEMHGAWAYSSSCWECDDRVTDGKHDRYNHTVPSHLDEFVGRYGQETLVFVQ